jgi:pyrophosphatase PpaX
LFSLGGIPVQLRGVIFDLDGTLADTLPVCFAAFREVFEAQLGVTRSDDEIHALFGPSEEGIIARELPERVEESYRDYLTAYERLHAACPGLFPGIAAALEQLAERGAQLAIVTAKGPGSAAISARLLGLERHFDILEAGSPAGNEKPRSIRRVLECWHLAPEQVAYVGDSIHDVCAARAVGLLPLAVAWATTADAAALRAEGPHATFETVAEFSDWIEQAFAFA